jgi:hypothetical protein
VPDLLPHRDRPPSTVGHRIFLCTPAPLAPPSGCLGWPHAEQPFDQSNLEIAGQTRFAALVTVGQSVVLDCSQQPTYVDVQAAVA